MKFFEILREQGKPVTRDNYKLCIERKSQHPFDMETKKLIENQTPPNKKSKEVSILLINLNRLMKLTLKCSKWNW